ncbi:MAG: hypothetical protein ACLUB2_04910 [Butyricicoccus pullicaecorum]
METTLLAAGVVTILVIALVVRQVVRGCARTVFAAPPEPTPEEIEASRTHKTLPQAVELDADTAAITAQACAALIAGCRRSTVGMRQSSRRGKGTHTACR